MEVEGRWKWKRDGSRRSMEVEARWKWKMNGSGSAIVTAPNGPNEPLYYCNQIEFQSLLHSSGVHPRKHTVPKIPCALLIW